MRVTATDAKERFGALCAHAERAPVFVEKAGRIDTMILSAELFQPLESPQNSPFRLARQQAFEAAYAGWIAAENKRVAEDGVPGADLRPW